MPKVVPVGAPSFMVVDVGDNGGASPANREGTDNLPDAIREVEWFTELNHELHYEQNNSCTHTQRQKI